MREYGELAMKKVPDLHFALNEVTKGMESADIYYLVSP
jgi:hypothetical protein